MSNCPHARQVTPEDQYGTFRCLDCGVVESLPPNGGTMNGQHWVLYHSTAWALLVEQGYVTSIVETRHGQQWALMLPPT